MEPSSNKPNDKDLKEGVSSLQAEIEAIKEINLDLYSSLQEELTKANKLWENTRALLTDINDQEILVLRSIKNAHEHLQGVFAAWVYLLAGNVPEACIKVDKKKNPVDVSWDSCRVLLKDWSFFKEKMLTVKDLIDEGKISFEKTEPVRGYLELSWFNVETLKKKPVGYPWRMGEAIRDVIAYFDIVRDVKGKMKEKEKFGEGKFQEKED